MSELQVVHIDEFSRIVHESIGKYKVTLTGSCERSFTADCFKYEVHSVEPELPIKYIYSDIKIFEKI
ncbi:MAG: hypothetical protein IPO21_14555 [Bacteroidales bacterium]|nr:hypothetical protein [Bacteroidales bacterium]